ncbi:hypothetical protein I317_07497 [Kwoniella heveanensis CBS 569]|nr:hypothetical protein I317_07497 [Kwoniella heveanensis CBS 569]
MHFQTLFTTLAILSSATTTILIAAAPTPVSAPEQTQAVTEPQFFPPPPAQSDLIDPPIFDLGLLGGGGGDFGSGSGFSSGENENVKIVSQAIPRSIPTPAQGQGFAARRIPPKETYRGDRRAIALTEDGGTRTVRSVIEPSTTPNAPAEADQGPVGGIGRIVDKRQWGLIPNPGIARPHYDTDDNPPYQGDGTGSGNDGSQPYMDPNPSATQWEDIRPSPTIGWIPIDGGVPADAGGVSGGPASGSGGGGGGEDWGWSENNGGGDDQGWNGDGNEWGWKVKRMAAV